MAYDWTPYFDAMAGTPARETCLRALDLFDAERGGGRVAGHVAGTCPCHPNAIGVALDFGCGEGRDAREMVSRGWCVLAVDSSAEAIRRVIAGTPEPLLGLLKTGVETFEEMPLPPGMFDLVVASFSIPHCDPRDFPGLWGRIVATLRPGGRFAGQFFGPHDSWAVHPDGVTRTFHTRQEVESMFKDFEIEHLEEVDRPGCNAMGEPKHWHVFHVVARKRAVGVPNNPEGR